MGEEEANEDLALQIAQLEREVASLKRDVRAGEQAVRAAPVSPAHSRSAPETDAQRAERLERVQEALLAALRELMEAAHWHITPNPKSGKALARARAALALAGEEPPVPGWPH